MSISLVKKSLELTEIEVPVPKERRSKLAIKKTGKLAKKDRIDDKKKAIVVAQNIREKSRQLNEPDAVEKNVQRLLKLSSRRSAYRKQEVKLLDRISKGCKKDERISEPVSAFTEEDFAEFEKEYFGNN